MSSSPTDRRVGVRDVARLAGVSTQTVSRVLNDFPGVREDTRERVQSAIAELNYHLNNTARAFGTDTSRMIGVIASDSTLHGPAVAVEALERAARSAGRWVATAYADAADAASILSAAHHLEGLGVDAIVLASADIAVASVRSSLGRDLPVVALSDEVGADRNRRGAEAIAQHLSVLGHKRVAVIAGPARWPEAVARDAGFTAVFDAPALRFEGDWSAASAAALGDELATAIRAGSITAIIAANDQMALGAVSALAERGLRVPDDVSVTGFDDNPDAAFYVPSLTTVGVDVPGAAARAVALVLGEETPLTVAEPHLAVRSSTAAVR